MTWDDLLAKRRVQRHDTTREELDAIRGLVDRDLRDARIAELSADRRFAIAYNAVFLLGKMVLACAGYRAISGSHHRTTFEALPLAMGAEMKGRARYFQVCRRKRNIVDYDLASEATETETSELLTSAQTFRDEVERWLAHNHPKYGRI